MEDETSNPKPASTPNQQSCWSSIVKKQPTQKPQTQTNPASQIFVESCNSTKGISVAVVDANAVIQGGQTLVSLADKFVTVPEVHAEIRDPVSRHRLSLIPFSIDSMEPSPESLNKVIKFARATGDLQTLSDVDLKLIALTYTLEAQIHGTKHIRDIPPPVHTVNVRRLPEKELPGWGSNVPNLEEWEALDREPEDKSNSNSRILPLKDLSLNTIPSDEHSEHGTEGTIADTCSENQDDAEHGKTMHRRYAPQKKVINIEGKKMVADGVDASQGQLDDDSGDWLPAVSRSTHRRFLRRKARRQHFEALIEKESQEDQDKHQDNNMCDPSKGLEEQSQQKSEDVHKENGTSDDLDIEEVNNGDENLSSILEQMRLEEDSQEALQEEEVEDISSAGVDSSNPTIDNSATVAVEIDPTDVVSEGFDPFEISSQTNESVDVSYADDVSSEQSWMLRSLSESSIACVTGDFAMQNVLLQMGLRLLAPGGMQIRQLQRWILKCHACYAVTAEIGRIFCPKCGNGGTLRKVAVTVGENGIVLAARRPRIILRGTKFSLPTPQGGRDAITKNLILREDQLPQKFLYPRSKKKANKEGDDLFSSDDLFTHHTDKKTPFRPPVRKALAVFSGKRNPNDNHYSRAKH